MKDRAPAEAGEAGHLRKLRQRPPQVVPVDLGAEQAVGSTAQPVHKSQVALPVTHVMTGSVGAFLPEPPARQLRRILSEEVLLGAAGDTRGSQTAAQQLGATALAGAHEGNSPLATPPGPELPDNKFATGRASGTMPGWGCRS